MDYPKWTLGKLGVRLVDLFRRTDSLKNWPAIEASQWLSRDELREQQWEQLRRMVKHASTKVPYYRRIFAELGMSHEDIRQPADLVHLPRLTKEIIRHEGDAMLAEDFAHWQPRAKATSGSTGTPLRYWIDRGSHGLHWAFIWRAWQQSGFKPGDRWATLSGGALVPAHVDLRQKTYLWLNGALHLPSYHLTEEDFAEYADTLAGEDLPLLYAYPSSLRLFARWLARENRSLRTRSLFTTSELLPPAWRAEIEAATGGRVFDIYGNNDGGILSFECERHEGYHLNMEGVFVEIVDEEDRPLPRGEAGEVLSTNLRNYAMPFLRYAPGDGGALAQDDCPCGRGLERLASIEGRVRDFVVTADGRQVHGAFFNHFEPFYEASWLEAFQVQQRKAGEISLMLQPQQDPGEQELDQLRTELAKGLGADTKVEILLVDEIPRGKAGKHRLIVSDIAD